MKLADYLPEVPKMAAQMGKLGSQIDIFNDLLLNKSAGDTGSGPTFGVDYIVNTYVRNQLAYRKQLIQDLQTIAYTVEELRAPILHITGEVFRRGIKFEPIKENPDPKQLNRLKKFMDDCNLFDQGLEEVLRQFHWDLNTVDDAFIYFAKEYYDAGDKKLRSRVTEIRRINPALIEFDLDETGLPKNSHFFCPIHREKITQVPAECDEEKCDQEKQPAMYRYLYRTEVHYFLDSEIVHLSKFNPTETYGWSPILTIFEKALTLIGMDRNLYRYFFERKVPASMVMVTTDDPESLKREREALAARTRQDPNYIPMIAVSSRTNRGRVDMVRLFHTLQEMDYLPVRAEIRERVSAVYGVSPVWQGAPDSFGGLTQQTSQLTVMSRVVERDQRQIMEKVFPSILNNFGITDYTLVLPNPEEKAEATRIAQSQQKSAIAQQLLNMGFDVKLKDNDVSISDIDFLVGGEPVPTAKLQGEQQALALEQAEQQAAMQEAMMKQQAEGGGEEGEEAAEGGGEEAAEGGGEEEGEIPIEGSMEKAVTDVPERIANLNTAVPRGKQNIEKTIPTSQRKFQGRMGGITPDHNDKTPLEERDIEDYMETRERKAEDRAFGLTETSTWIDSLADQGYAYPIIKEVSSNGQQVWFANNGEEYVGNLTGTGVDKIQKAYFGNPVFSDVGGKKPLGEAYTSETGDGTSKAKAEDVSRYTPEELKNLIDDEEDD